MRKVLLLLITLGGSVLAPAVASAQITIDNFSLPVQPPSGTDYLIVSGTGIVSGATVQPTVDAIGGTRVYYAQKTNTTATTGTVLTGLTGTQAYRQGTAPNTAGRSKLLYGYSAVSTAALDVNNYTGGHTLANMNQNFSSLGSVALDYSLGGSGSTGTISVTLISGSEGTAQVATATLPITTATNATINFTRASFLASNAALNFADIDQIVVSLDGTPLGVNATIDNIRVSTAAIPEPTSIAMMGLTVGACASGYYLKRRRKGTYRRRR